MDFFSETCNSNIFNSEISSFGANSSQQVKQVFLLTYPKEGKAVEIFQLELLIFIINPSNNKMGRL